MANHSFAKLDDNNLVLTMLAVDDDCNNGDEATGVTFLTNLTGWSNGKSWDQVNPLLLVELGMKLMVLNQENQAMIIPGIVNTKFG